MHQNFTRRFLRSVVFVALLVGMLAIPLLSAAQSNQRGPIVISGDNGFSVDNGVVSGQGTEADPFIIENLIIDATGEDNAIRLETTTKHVIIRNCQLFNADDGGIQLESAQNVTITECFATENRRGFNVVRSSNILIENNLTVFNRQIGIAIFDSQGVKIFDNVSRNNWALEDGEPISAGIYVDKFSQSIGANNQSSGHRLDIRVFKLFPEDRGLPRAEQEEANAYDIFSTFSDEKQASCDLVFEEYFLFIQSVNTAAELDEAYCAELYSILSALPIHFRSSISQIIFQGDSERILGAYTGIGTVRLWSIDNIKEFVEVIVHEMGHATQSRLFTNQLDSEWTSLFLDSGNDTDNFARTFGDFLTTSGEVSTYGTFSDWEDFATLMEAFFRDTFALIERAERISEQKGKTLLLEKTKWLNRLILRGSEPVVYRVMIDWDSDAETTNYRLQRAEAEVSGGLPIYSDNLVWEEF